MLFRWALCRPTAGLAGLRDSRCRELRPRVVRTAHIFPLSLARQPFFNISCHTGTLPTNALGKVVKADVARALAGCRREWPVAGSRL